MPQDPPALTLSDIVHGMSPSPVPQPDMEDPHVRSPTPELLEEEQVFNMRKRVLELSSAADVNRELTLREKEMVEMVCRYFVVLFVSNCGGAFMLGEAVAPHT